MRNLKKRTIKAFTIVEILLAIGIFGLVSSTVSYFSLDAYKTAQNSRFRSNAIAYMQEISNALQVLRRDGWQQIQANMDGTNKYITYSGNKYTIVNGTNSVNKINISFTLNSVNRDASGNIVTSGGTLDSSTEKATITASWSDGFGQSKSLNSSIYLNDWSVSKWVQTTYADYQAGTQSNTIDVNTYGGEEELDIILYADWCNPLSTVVSADISGSGLAEGISAIPGNVITGTGANNSGVPFVSYSTTDSNPPTASVISQFSGYKTNQVFRDSNYGYLATQVNSKEFTVIQNINTTSPSEIGYFDAPGNGNGNAIYVSGNVGYGGVGSVLYRFNLASPPTGAQTQKGNTITLSGTIKNIKVVGNYAYVATASTSNQLQIVDVSDPTNMTLVGKATVNNAAGSWLDVKSDGTRVYLVTAYTSSGNNFFIIDTSNKTSGTLPITQPVIGGYKAANGESYTSVSSVSGDSRALLSSNNTLSTQEQYQVIDMSNEAAPVRCGGMKIPSGINGVSAVIWPSGNVYSYIITGDSAGEMKIIKGGLSAGNGHGRSFATIGNYYSPVFDTGSADPNYIYFSYNGITPNNTQLKVQVRASDNLADLSGPSTSPWYGPSGTSADYFIMPGGYIPANLQSLRYFQYNVYLYSDPGQTYTPSFYDSTLTYQK